MITPGHHLIVTATDDSTPDEPAYEWDIVCLNPDVCHGTGWQSCGGDHSGAPDLDDLEDDWVEIHDVPHTYRCEHGWVTAYPGCVLAEAVNDWGSDAASDIAYDHGVGTHVVDDDWDDDSLTLIYVETVVAPVTDMSSIILCGSTCGHDHNSVNGPSGCCSKHGPTPVPYLCYCDLCHDAARARSRALPVCPECAQGKCQNCDGTALDEATDDVGACTCQNCQRSGEVQ